MTFSSTLETTNNGALFYVTSAHINLILINFELLMERCNFGVYFIHFDNLHVLRESLEDWPPFASTSLKTPEYVTADSNWIKFESFTPENCEKSRLSVAPRQVGSPVSSHALKVVPSSFSLRRDRTRVISSNERWEQQGNTFKLGWRETSRPSPRRLLIQRWRKPTGPS